MSTESPRLADLPAQDLPPAPPAPPERPQAARRRRRRPHPLRSLILLSVALLVTTGLSFGLAASGAIDQSSLVAATAVALAISAWFVASLLLLLIGRR